MDAADTEATSPDHGVLEGDIFAGGLDQAHGGDGDESPGIRGR